MKANLFYLFLQLGHNLGMNHDDDRNNPWRKNCDKTQYIMAPKRGYEDKNSWSPCTREKIKEQYQVRLITNVKNAKITFSKLLLGREIRLLERFSHKW